MTATQLSALIGALMQKQAQAENPANLRSAGLAPAAGKPAQPK